jgi:hypothetical protein
MDHPIKAVKYNTKSKNAPFLKCQNGYCISKFVYDIFNPDEL